MSRTSQVAICCIVSLSLLVAPARVLAIVYGGGNYGTGPYDRLITNTTPTPGPGIPDSGCTQSAPGSAPWLYGATVENGNAVKLYFTDSADPVTHYVLEYGNHPGQYLWSGNNIGGKGIRTYVVRSLNPNTTYYFRVRGSNGCAPGSWSNEISIKTVTGVIVSKLDPDVDLETARPTPLPQTVVPNALKPTFLSPPFPTQAPVSDDLPLSVVRSSQKLPLWSIAGLVLAGILLAALGAFFIRQNKKKV